MHHSDRGGQYLSIRYTERLAEAGIEQSVGQPGGARRREATTSIVTETTPETM